MKVPTANIVVAFNKETMQRLFSEGATYKSLVAELSEGNEDALLFNNVANPNFISFEHSQGLGGGMKMVLSFIDPKDEFESRYFKGALNPAKLIQGYSNPEAEKTKGFITDKPDDVVQSQSSYSKEYVAQYKQELQKSIGERQIYVAYGTGNNLNLWSGPHRTILTNADLTLKGTKKITLTLTPTENAFDIGQRRGAYNEVANLNLQGLKIRYAGQSQEIEFLENKTYDPLKYLDIQEQGKNLIKTYQDEVQKALSDGGFKDLSSKIQKFDFHTMVVDAIRSYVQQATSNKNVIVLLPDLNLICRQAISDEANKVNIAKPVIATAAALATATTAALFGGFQVSRSKDLYEKSITDLGQEEMFVEGVLKKFGLRLHTADKEKSKKLQQEAIRTGAAGVSCEAEGRWKSAKEGVNKYYKDRYFAAVIDKTDRQVPDHKAVITTILDNIKALAQESYKMSTIVPGMVETDINVLKTWGTATGSGPWAKYYTLAGYDDFTENSSAIIVGDLALIKEYLYGGIDVNQKFKNVESLKSKAKQFKEKSNSLAFETLKFSTANQSSIHELEQKESAAKAQQYSLAAASQIPLHPMDKIILTNVTYNKIIRNIVYPVIKGSGAFGDISYIPDDFAYQDAEFSDLEKQYIEENGIPVFRYNTQNPNILDLKFKFGGVYFSELKMGYQKEISRLTSAVAEGVLPTGIGTFPIRTRGAAVLYLRSKGFSHGLGDKNKNEIIQSLAGRISPELAEELEVDSAEAGADSFAAIIEELEQKNLHGLVLVDQELPGNPNTIMADFAEDVYRKSFQMSITTLPTFHISKTASLNGPCIVFAQDQPILQNIRGPRSLMNKFFSGLYKIMGFKHTITTSGASSEFNLVKNAPSFKLEE